MARTSPAPAPALLDSELLNVFCRVAEARNFSRAAVFLDMAQPIVTRKIKRLEDELGVQLFVRSNRGCELTPEGELLFSRAGGILMQLAQVRDEVSTSSQKVSGTIAIGLPAAAGTLLAPHLMPEVAQRWPDLHVELTEALTGKLMESVATRELSLALVYDPPTDTGLIARPLLMERLHLVGVPRLAKRLDSVKRVQAADLARLPLVLPIRQQVVRVLLEDAFAEAGLPLVPRYEANSPLLLKAMTLQGLGFTVLTLGSMADEVAAGRLVAIPLEDRGMSLSLSLITTKEHGRLRVVQLMADLIEGEVRRMAASGDWPGSPKVIRPAKPLSPA
ncbi:LysR family transcriptional regulator [Ramlibacter sp. G-1-2-2]|uniref:LysR family transcriptional regulator n=1 Tax=Ramlibacter agri TaxID=2728837 RepID=A0A848H4Y4_9BURK|nr:LysR family transcriptional regulator [Ramlibacter agri]NML44300.1 LysR family transcriptional regulator [Ramlibacter agri]